MVNCHCCKVPVGLTEVKQNAPCTEKGRLPTEYPCIPFGTDILLVLSFFQKGGNRDSGACNPAAFSVAQGKS